MISSEHKIHSVSRHKVIVFTDLDGTLLDHNTYSFSPAIPALQILAARSIPVIPVTSKTLAELRPLMAILGLTGSAIAENGAVIKRGDDSIDCAGSRSKLLSCLANLPLEIRSAMRCFCDMSAAEIAEETGLDETAAELAASRKATEPFLWNGDENSFAALARSLSLSGFELIQGGRFTHIIPPRDKAAAIEVLVAQESPRPQIWALGDGPNDLSMLMAADRGALIANTHIEMQIMLPEDHNLFISARSGPAGWRDAIDTFLDSYLE